MWEYIGAKDTAFAPYGHRKQNVFYIIGKQGNNNFRIEKHSDYSGKSTIVGWKNLKQLKALIRTFTDTTEKGRGYLNKK